MQVIVEHYIEFQAALQKRKTVQKSNFCIDLSRKFQIAH